MSDAGTATGKSVAEGSKAKQVVRRARPVWDVIDVDAMTKELRTMLDSKSTAPSLDFRSLGTTKRTGG